ncbi:MAG: fibronectin type III domain-containing protein, partial [Thermoplasmata archaeon]|nr:fibronectin type III domain-containing protein [Thermoplasmata archaeon]
YVTAVNSRGESPPTRSVEVTVIRPPSSPRNLTLRQLNRGLHLSWLPPSDLGGDEVHYYRIYRQVEDGGYVLYKVVSGERTSLKDDCVENGIKYSYYVTAVNIAGESTASSEVSATQIGPPAPPVNITALQVNHGVLIRWSNAGEYSIAKHYLVYRGENTPLLQFVRSVDKCFYLDENVSVGNVYFYSVRAVNDAGVSIMPLPVRVVVGGPPQPPPDLTVLDNSSCVVLRWIPPYCVDEQSEIKEYRVYKGSRPDDLELAAVVIGEIEGFVDNDVEAGAVYYYAITAVNDYGESKLSHVVEVKVASGSEEKSGGEMWYEGNRETTSGSVFICFTALVAVLIPIVLFVVHLFRGTATPAPPRFQRRSPPENQ